MSNNKKYPESPYKYYKGSKETVIRTDETQKKAVTRVVKRLKYKKMAMSLVSIVLVITIIISGFIVGKKGVDRFLVLRNEIKNHKYAEIPEDVKKEMDGMTEEEKWALLYELYPELVDVKFPAGMLCDYAIYYAQNPQTIGYLRIPGTKVDYPVVQADNNDYYVNHDFYGKSTSYGAVFATYKNAWKPLDRNTLLYGHNMNDGTRFASLHNYKNLDYYRQNPIIEFDTLYEKNVWKVVACYITNGTVASDNGYFFDFTFNHCSDTCFEEYIEEVDKRKFYETGVDLDITDTILTLCTCAHYTDDNRHIDDGRLIVIARKLREGESAEVDVSLSKHRSTPVKYPDAYYPSPEANPYINDKKFYLY